MAPGPGPVGSGTWASGTRDPGQWPGTRAVWARIVFCYIHIFSRFGRSGWPGNNHTLPTTIEILRCCTFSSLADSFCENVWLISALGSGNEAYGGGIWAHKDA